MVHPPFIIVFFCIILLVACGQMSQTIFVPAMGEIAADFSISAGSVQSLMAVYLFSYGISQLFYGPLADRFGRRKMIFIGLAIFICGAWISSVAHSMLMLSLGNLIQGLGIGVGGVMARTMMRDLYTGAALTRANSFVAMGVIIAPLIAPVIGGFLLENWGWSSIFLFLTVLGVFVFAVLWFSIPETCPSEKRQWQGFFRPHRALLADHKFRYYLLVLVALLGGIVLFEAATGVLLSDVLKMSAQEVSFWFIVPLPASFIGSIWVARLSHHWSSKKIIWFGISCAATGACGMWLSGWFGWVSLAPIIGCGMLYFFAAGILFPVVTSGAMEPFPHQAGSAGALVGGLQNLAGGAFLWVASLLPQDDQSVLGMMMTLMAALMALGYLGVCQKKAQAEDLVSDLR